MDARNRALAGTALALTFALQAPQIARAQMAPGVLVVPFTVPGDKAPFEDAALDALVAKLKAAGANVTISKPLDPFSLVSAAPELCTSTAAHAIVTGRLRVEQTNTSGSLGYIPYVGSLAKTLVNTHPSHAVVLLDRLDCNGSVRARSEGVNDDVHHGANVGAGVTVAVQNAVDVAADKLIGMPDAPPALPSLDDVWLQTGAEPSIAPASVPQASVVAAVAPQASAAPSSDPKRVAFTAVEDTIDPDIHEQFESAMLLKHLAARGYSVAEIAPLDRFDIAPHAAAICATAHADRILVSAVRYEQSAIDGLFSTSYPTHAFLHFDVIDCSGAVHADEDITSDVHYAWSNVGAGISQAIDNGIDTGLDKVGLTREATPRR